ncbi:hypothetical protein INT43_005054 [Umbelopsis isabellina]|uniref:Uncharacterized protein n=1 Tax=Mortierella isabellina TaxID=91625 RepID=A0A8H7PGP3_MORIS|nr:hypothetical protein INT43_005054 [Umbelopsis isabellina]
MDAADATFHFVNGLEYKTKVQVMLREPRSLEKAYKQAEYFSLIQQTARGVVITPHVPAASDHYQPQPQRAPKAATTDGFKCHSLRCGRIGIRHVPKVTAKVDFSGKLLAQSSLSIPAPWQSADINKLDANASNKTTRYNYVLDEEVFRVHVDDLVLSELLAMSSFNGVSLPLYPITLKGQNFTVMIDSGATEN